MHDERMAHVISLISDAKKRENTGRLIVNTPLFFTSWGSRKTHHVYTGGLVDHALLVALLSILHYNTAPVFLQFITSKDDVIISALFHDFSKVGYGIASFSQFVPSIDVINTLIDNDLYNQNIRDGILHSHGGWSGYKDEPYGLTSIIVHASDMIATHVIRGESETKTSIALLLNDRRVS